MRRPEEVFGGFLRDRRQTRMLRDHVQTKPSRVAGCDNESGQAAGEGSLDSPGIAR